MRQIRIFHPQSFLVNERLWLSDEASHHLSVVLRAKVGQNIILFDGNHQEAKTSITSIEKKRVQVLIEQIQVHCLESPLKIHLAQGIAKGDRMSFSLQKAVELGVTEITPLWTQHVALKWDEKNNEKKYKLWQNIIISACEQSGRNFLPRLNPPKTFEDFMHSHRSHNLFILEPRNGKKISAYPWKDTAETTLLIGPEGGFSQEESKDAEQKGYQALTLGPRVLRTETAVLAALAVLQAYQGDL